MKRIRVAPGKFVTISPKLAEKAARLSPLPALTTSQIKAYAAMEAKAGGWPLLGAARPSARLARVKPLGKAALLNKLGLMIEQSGGTCDDVTLRTWLDSWLDTPLPQLHGATPAQTMTTEDGRRQVEALLERLRGGLPG